MWSWRGIAVTRRFGTQLIHRWRFPLAVGFKKKKQRKNLHHDRYFTFKFPPIKHHFQTNYYNYNYWATTLDHSDFSEIFEWAVPLSPAIQSISKLGVYSDHFLSRLLSLSGKPKFSCNAYESGRPHTVTRSSAECKPAVLPRHVHVHIRQLPTYISCSSLRHSLASYIYTLRNRFRSYLSPRVLKLSKGALIVPFHWAPDRLGWRSCLACSHLMWILRQDSRQKSM